MSDTKPVLSKKDRLRLALRRVHGRKNHRNQDQEIVYAFLEEQSKKPAPRIGGQDETPMICPNMTIAQTEVRDTIIRYLKMVDSLPSDDDNQPKIKTE